jgi:arsenate reductase (glutaredoxin)
MSSVTIYHNPRCGKSRATLALLRERGIEPRVVEYLREPPTAEELTRILARMGKAPRDILRRKEAQEAGLAVEGMDDATLIRAMIAHPIAIERPIVVCGERAALGRPPEAVLEIL